MTVIYSYLKNTEDYTMNEKTLNQIAEMKKQTIGVEVEMNSITRQKAAKLAAEFFGTGRSQNTASRNGYCTWSAWDADGREWKFQKDVSISGPDDEKCEMVTPILRYDDIETLQELIPQASQGGCKKRCHKRMRRTHSHRSKRSHPSEPPQPCQHYGKPRKPLNRRPCP